MILLFLTVSILSGMIYVCLIMQQCLPAAHDTFQYLQLQYVYFNEIARRHEIPHWFPFVHQGFVGNYYFTGQTMILAPFVDLLALAVKGMNYLYVFYAGMWFDELFLILGVMLWGRLYYRRLGSVLFVALTVWGSTIWYPQVFWGMHLFYFIPMVLFSFHRFLAEQKMFYLAGALLMFWVGFIGSGVYTNIFIAFVLLVYVAAVFLFSPEARRSLITLAVKISKAEVLLLVFLVIMIGLSIYYVKFADAQIAYLGVGRTEGNRVALDTFMQYGGAVSMAKYLSFFDRANVRFLTADVQLYAGFAMPFLAIIGALFSRNKMRWPVVVAAAVIILFSSGTVVSKLFYYYFPLGNVFRHIGLTATVAKLFVIMLAGFGLDQILNYLKDGRYRAWFLWGGLFILFVFLCRGFSVWGDDPLAALGEKERALLSVVRYMLFTAVLVAGVMAWRGTKYRFKVMVGLFFVIVAFELFSYKYAKTVTVMPRVPEKVIALFKPMDYSFAMKRAFTTGEHSASNERLQTLWPVLEQEARLGRLWSVYDTLELFFITDTFQSSFRGDYALVPVKDFLTTALSAPAQVQGPVYLRHAGVLADKVGVFSQLNYAADDVELGRIFSRAGYDPGTLWTTADQVVKINGPMDRSFVLKDPASTGGRVAAKVMVKAFSFNQVVFDIDVKGPSGRPYFLYYADAYHPFWKVRVNGEPRPVLKANIGYKAVVIPAGRSEVAFSFGHPFYDVSVACTLLLCLGVVGWAGYLYRQYFMMDRARV